MHDSAGERTRELLETHPLAGDGTLRHLRLPAGSGTAARQRNRGWQAARAPLVAFTDDDCRPEEGWLEALLAGAAAHPGAIVQGRTAPDPFESELLVAPHARSITADPPAVFVQTCNVLYPRELLARVGGLDEGFPRPAGEDTDLALRAQADGAALVGAPEAIVYHCVEAHSLRSALRLSRKWRDIPRLARIHPQVREAFVARVFWRPAHAQLTGALAGAGLAAALRRPALALAGAPYVVARLTRRGSHPRRVAVCALELPGQLAVDLSELLTLIAGSIEHRTLLL